MRESAPAPDGVLLVDKPSGCTSAAAVQQVRRLLGGGSVGHTGTLDPLATGLLPMVLGEATKLSRWVMGGAKKYRAGLFLGVSTDTADADGQRTGEAPVPDLGLDSLRTIAESFLGCSQQVPPMHSALHHQGRRLHVLARKGLSVPRETRSIRIDAIAVTRWVSPVVEFEVTCSAGTYVRSLGEDLARKLGTLGHLQFLRRLSVEEWQVEQALPLVSLDRARVLSSVIPVATVLRRFQKLEVGEEVVTRLSQGQRLPLTFFRDAGVSLPQSGIAWCSGEQGVPVVLVEIPNDINEVVKVVRVLRPRAAPAPAPNII